MPAWRENRNRQPSSLRCNAPPLLQMPRKSENGILLAGPNTFPILSMGSDEGSPLCRFRCPTVLRSFFRPCVLRSNSAGPWAFPPPRASSGLLLPARRKRNSSGEDAGPKALSGKRSPPFLLTFFPTRACFPQAVGVPSGATSPLPRKELGAGLVSDVQEGAAASLVRPFFIPPQVRAPEGQSLSSWTASQSRQWLASFFPGSRRGSPTDALPPER